MSRSLLKRANGPSRNSGYFKGVALKLSAFILAVAVFFPLAFLLSRPNQLKDFSEGSLPQTFATRSRDLQRELIYLNNQRALPKQRELQTSIASRRFGEGLSDIVASPDFQSLKTAADQFNADFAAQGVVSASDAARVQNLLRFARLSQTPSFNLGSLEGALSAAFSQGEESAAPVSLRDPSVADCPSPVPDLQGVLKARFVQQLAAGDCHGAVSTGGLMLKMSNCALNSTEPDIAPLLDSLKMISGSLGVPKVWTSNASLRELQQELQRQRAKSVRQKAILAAERERMLFAFEQVRQTGLRSLDGLAPRSSMLADALRELRPRDALKALKSLWFGVSYSPDSDEVAALRLLRRVGGPGFMPYFLAEPLLAPQFGDGELSVKLRESLLASLRKQSEALALLEASDIALSIRLKAEPDKSKVSPLSGLPYGVLKAQDKARVVYGRGEANFVKIELPAE